MLISFGINFKIAAAALSLILKPCLSILLEIFYSKAIIKLSAWNEIQPLSDMKVVMIVGVFKDVCIWFYVFFSKYVFTDFRQRKGEVEREKHQW